MENFTIKQNYFNINFSYSFYNIRANCYYSTSKFYRETSAATPTKKIYNVKVILLC
jgi:hypothetical protein